MDLNTHAAAEAQVAALADDIAYHSHDLDDGLRARLFGPEEIAHLPVVGGRCRQRAAPAWTCRRRGCATKPSAG